MLRYLVLTTGSCGNSYIFSNEEDSIVVDCGVTRTKFLTECEKYNISLKSIRGILLTHLHPDHAKGVGVVSRKLGIPVFLSKDCYERGLYLIKKIGIDINNVRTFSFDESFSLESFIITPFHTFHDSPGSSGFLIESKKDSIFLLTDTGRIPCGVFSYSRESNLKFIEANYDQNMLDSGPYPPPLKRRISGLYGHLENSEAVDFAKRTSKSGDSVYFIHLSENNNKSEIVRELAKEEIDSGIYIRVLERGEEVYGEVEDF